MSKRKRTSSGRKPRSKASFAASRRKHLQAKKQSFTRTQRQHLKDILAETKKWTDVHKADQTLTTTMAMVVSDAPGGQGGWYAVPRTADEDENRNGSTIRGTTVDIRGTLKTSYEGTQVVRVMAIQFAERTTAAINQVLHSITPAAGTGESFAVVDSFRKMDPKIKYNVLYDKNIVIPAGDVGAGTDVKTKAFRIYLKLTPSQSKMTYDYDTAVTPAKNPIYMFACYADNTGTTSQAPKLQYHGRLRYVDV